MDKVNIVTTLSGIVGGFVGFLFGEWGTFHTVLISFFVIDFITGMMASSFEGELSSRVGMKGIAKKVFILILVTVGHLMDTVTGTGSMIGDMIIFFYLANEALSIIENAGRIGLPIPVVLTEAIKGLKAKSGGSDDDDKGGTFKNGA